MLVRSPSAEALRAALAHSSAQLEQVDAATIRIKGLDTVQVGHAAYEAGIELHELSTQRFDLEDVFFALTRDGGASGEGSSAEGGPR